MIEAHGATVTIGAQRVTVRYSELLAALGKPSESLPLSEVTDIALREPTDFDCGWVRLAPSFTVRFSPGQAVQARQLRDDVQRAQQGEVPGVAGLNAVAVDVETANGDWSSVCQIGAARIRDGRVVAAESWLCSPPPGRERFDPHNVAIHGITAEDVADAPAFAEQYAKLVEFVGNDIIIAHNAYFDTTALTQAARSLDLNAAAWRFADTLPLARKLRLGQRNNKLGSLAEFFAIPLEHAHDACSDAVACAEIAVAFARHEGFEGGVEQFFASQGFALGVIGDAVIPVARDSAALARATGGGTEPAANPGRGRRGAPAWRRAAAPETIPDPNADAPEGPLKDQNVTLTGDFEPHDKGELWQLIAERGGTIGKNVTKKTTILVAGPWDSKTSKQRRAEELIEKGQEIQIWTAQDLYREVGL